MTVFTLAPLAAPATDKPITFKPCPICGEVEKMTTIGVYVIQHRYELHGIPTPPSKRLSTEALMDLADAKVLDRIGDRREA